MKRSVWVFFLLLFFERGVTAQDILEPHLSNIRALTHGGLNAEAYFSAEGKLLIYQAIKDDYPDDRIFVMNNDGSNIHLVCTGTGRTTYRCFSADVKSILFASTHLASTDCLSNPDRTQGYVWAVFRGYDIISANPDSTGLKRLTTTEGYDAEGMISPNGNTIVFTSARDGDLEVYTMNADGSH